LNLRREQNPIVTTPIGSVAVIGGGIGGLVSALELARAGAQVTLFESSDRLGGLGTFFNFDGRTFEQFYHCLLPSDAELLQLLAELGLSEEIYWHETEFAYLSQGKLFGLNSPLDLLRFSALPLVDRLRVGFTALVAKLSSDKGLDDVTAAEWLRSLSGERAFRAFWQPMLQAKFGGRFLTIPALWFWTRFNREKGQGRELKGYVRGGYRRILHRLEETLSILDVKIRCSSPVESLSLSGSEELAGPVTLRCNGEDFLFDRVVYTGPLPMLKSLTQGPLLDCALASLDSTLDAQGVVNLVLILRKPVSGRFYWIATVDEGLPFQGVVESTQLISSEDSGGYHLAYLTNYLHRTEPEFSLSDEEIRVRYLNEFFRLFPEVSESDIAGVRIFRAPFVEPLYNTGYLLRKPKPELIPRRIFLATTSQVYPQVTSWNGATGVARQASRTLIASLKQYQTKEVEARW